jgi:hypothetical protein
MVFLIHDEFADWMLYVAYKGAVSAAAHGLSARTSALCWHCVRCRWGFSEAGHGQRCSSGRWAADRQGSAGPPRPTARSRCRSAFRQGCAPSRKETSALRRGLVRVAAMPDGPNRDRSVTTRARPVPRVAIDVAQRPARQGGQGPCTQSNRAARTHVPPLSPHPAVLDGRAPGLLS